MLVLDFFIDLVRALVAWPVAVMVIAVCAAYAARRA